MPEGVTWFPYRLAYKLSPEAAAALVVSPSHLNWFVPYMLAHQPKLVQRLRDVGYDTRQFPPMKYDPEDPAVAFYAYLHPMQAAMLVDGLVAADINQLRCKPIEPKL